MRIALQHAMKQGDHVRVWTPRRLGAGLRNQAIAESGRLDDSDALEVVGLATKSRRGTIALARTHARDEVTQHIEATVQDFGVTSPKDVGHVLKVLMQTLKGGLRDMPSAGLCVSDWDNFRRTCCEVSLQPEADPESVLGSRWRDNVL